MNDFIIKSVSEFKFLVLDSGLQLQFATSQCIKSHLIGQKYIGHFQLSIYGIGTYGWSTCLRFWFQICLPAHGCITVSISNAFFDFGRKPNFNFLCFVNSLQFKILIASVVATLRLPYACCWHLVGLIDGAYFSHYNVALSQNKRFFRSFHFMNWTGLPPCDGWWMFDWCLVAFFHMFDDELSWI